MEIVANKIRVVYKELQKYHNWMFPTVLVKDGFIGGRKSMHGISDGADGQMFLMREPHPDRWQWKSLFELLSIVAQLDHRRIPQDCIVYADDNNGVNSKQIIDLDKTIKAREKILLETPNALSKKYSYSHTDYFKELPKDLEKRMTKADWHYEYSDSPRVWEKGVIEIKSILKDLEKLAKTEDGFEISKILWDKHVPEYSVPKPGFLDDDKFYAKKLNVMTEKEENHIKNQFKHAGAEAAFTPELLDRLQKGEEKIIHPYRFSNNGDQNTADFHVHKSKDSSLYFLNKFDLTVAPENSKKEIKETFYLTGQDNVKLKEGEQKLRQVNKFTLKKAANYLAGRPVFSAFSDKEGNQYEAWAKRKFNVEKGKFEMAKYRKEYPFSLKDATKNYSIKELAIPEQKDRLMESYQRGNLQKVTFVASDGREEQLYTSLQIGLVQGGSLNVYDLNKDRIGIDQLLEKGYIGKDLAEEIKERLTQKPVEQKIGEKIDLPKQENPSKHRQNIS